MIVVFLMQCCMFIVVNYGRNTTGLIATDHHKVMSCTPAGYTDYGATSQVHR